MATVYFKPPYSANLNKAEQATAGEHVVQIPGYMCSSRIKTGLLVNFGSPVLSVKKYLMLEGG